MHQAAPLTVFILYQSLVFAFGVRGLLIGELGIQVIGMEPASRGKLELARSLRPDVLVLEEPVEEFAPLATLLGIPATGGLVTLSLHHLAVKAYQVRQLPLDEAEGLAEAIWGIARHEHGGPGATRLAACREGGGTRPR